MTAPFTASYVLSTTAKHQLAAVDRSIEKTHARYPSFANDSEKSREIMEALMILQGKRKALLKEIESYK